jgi:predicted enzyme involved in methoxymalonyl-ACP biosynthesis
MSCRVLGRKVEEAVLVELLGHARSRGVGRLRGVYRPTDRNKLVEQHYAKLGFTLVEEAPDGVTVWELDVATANVEPPAMAVRSGGFQQPVPTSEAALPNA